MGMSGASARAAAEELAGRLKALEGADGEGALISSWRRQEHRGAVLAPVAHEALPLVIEGLRKLLATVSLEVLMIGTCSPLAEWSRLALMLSSKPA